MENETKPVKNKTKSVNGGMNRRFLLFGVLLILLLLGVDQWTKHLAVAHLKDQTPVTLIPGVLILQYLENRGMAFGLMQDKQWLFILLTVVFLAVAVYCLVRLPKTGRFLPLCCCLTVLIAGGIGNLIDRVWHNYVVDFVYFILIDFPLFNFADICVTLSMLVLLVLLFFRYKEKDFDLMAKRLFPHRKKAE